MKKIFKITGIIAVIITLVCNLQYAIFSYDITNTPNKAVAAWTDASGTKYCGSTGNTTFRTGSWVWRNDDYYKVVMHWYGYDTGYYEFYVNNSGTQCGQGYVAANSHNSYRDVTNIIPTWITY